MRYTVALFVLLASACAAHAQQDYPESYMGARASAQGLSVVPSTPTVVLASPSRVPEIQQIFAANTTGSAVTFTVKDGSTNCGGAACIIVPTVTVPANGQYYATFKGIPAVNGITWSAGTANALHAFVQWVY